MKLRTGQFASTGVATLVLVTAAAVALPLPARALPPPSLPISVSTTADAGPGSLRQAIITANNRAGHNTIVFNINAAGVQTIAPATDLDPITETVTIDGYTQLGALAATPNGNAVMMIVIDAAGLGHGLNVATDNTVVKGLVVQNASAGTGTGIEVTGDSNVISGNYLGTTDSGLQGAGNSGAGLDVRGNDNLVGGSSAADRNVISANSGGVLIDGNDNTVAGNRIGTNDAGTAALGNVTNGVEIHGDRNVIGGDLGAERNLISGNTTGVLVETGTGNRVLGNRIGTGVGGAAALGNSDGVLVRAESTDVIGNLVSGNFGDGITIEAKSLVLKNRIGTTALGAAALPNGQDGIVVEAPGTVIGTATNGNLISANGGDGISIWSGADGAQVHANAIGTTVAGAPLGNGDDGIETDAPGVEIEGNVVSANADHGLSVLGADSMIEGNTIGAGAAPAAAALGNAAEGIEISGDGSRVAHNEIAQNGTDGVLVSGGTDITVLSNAITGNGDLGIDLGANGVTPNDAGDVDAGANDLLNFPTVPVASTAGGVTTVDWKIGDGLRASTQQLEFFGQPSCDASGNGEGLTFLGSVVVTTSATDGSVSGQSQLATSVPTGQVVVATATLQGPAPAAALGSTSEISPCTVVT